MSPILWLSAVALGYIALGKSIFMIIDSARRRSYGLIFMWLLGCGTAYFITMVWVNYSHVPPKYVAAPIPAISFFVLLTAWIWAWGTIASHGLKWQEIRHRKELSRQIKLHLALSTGALIFSLPFYWLITTSLKPDERTNMFPPDIIPMEQREVKIKGEMRKVFLLNEDGRIVKVAKLNELEKDSWEVVPISGGVIRTIESKYLKPDLYPVAKWSNYKDALDFLPPEYKKGLVPLWNTVYVTLLTIIGTVISSSLVAFSFARLRWPGKNLLFIVLLATMMVPPAVTMLPVFLIFRQLNWIDTLRPLWVPAFFGSAFNIFLLRQFFLTIPNDLEDAAKIDGCSYFTIYWKIMLPLIKPALAALTIFAFMGSWNNFMGPLIYISSPEKMTLAYALQLFQGMHGGEPAMMMAASALVMLPVLIVFFFTQRYMIQGVTLTGIKG